MYVFTQPFHLWQDVKQDQLSRVKLVSIQFFFKTVCLIITHRLWGEGKTDGFIPFLSTLV